MDEHKKKEGISVRELEGYAKKYRMEFFFILLFVLSSLFSLIFWGCATSVILTAAGGIIGVFIPLQVEHFSKKFCAFVAKQEKTTQLIIGILWLIVAIFLAPLIFLKIGLHAGKSMAIHCREIPTTHHHK